MTFVPQGNNKVSLATLPASGQKALFTTDLDPCLAVMIFQPGHALMMHVDHVGAGGIGGTSVAEVLKRHVSTGAAGTQVHLIGCSARVSLALFRVASAIASSRTDKGDFFLRSKPSTSCMPLREPDDGFASNAHTSASAANVVIVPIV